jgi:hypothetical protein
MCSVREKRELALLVRMAREFDVVGDVTVTVDNPSELLAWAVTLKEPRVVAWRADASGCRFVQVSATRDQAPIRGHVAAVLKCREEHDRFWRALGLADLACGDQRDLSSHALTDAWADLPTDVDGEPIG